MTHAPLRTLAALVGVGGLLALSGCGDDDDASKNVASLSPSSVAGDSNETTESPEPMTDLNQVLFEHAKCMREQGLDYPDPLVESLPDGGEVVSTGEGVDTDSPEYDEASQTCDPMIEAFEDSFTPSPEEQAEREELELAYAKCMRDHGLDWPDPIFTENGDMAIPDGFNPDFDDPAFPELDALCAEKAYGPRPDAGT